VADPRFGKVVGLGGLETQPQKGLWDELGGKGAKHPDKTRVWGRIFTS